MRTLLACTLLWVAGCAGCQQQHGPIEIEAPVALDSISVTAPEDMVITVECSFDPVFSYDLPLKAGEPKTIGILTDGCAILTPKPTKLLVQAQWVTAEGDE